MRVVVQRVKSASVSIVEQKYYQEIGKGLLILLGIKNEDNEEDVNFIADKCSNLRIFSRRDAFADDVDDKMNISIKDVDGEVLIISQFTLYGETTKGNRPNFTEAAKPDHAIPLYEKFISRVKSNLGEDKVKAGIFGAMMDIQLVNYGPVTVLIESNK